MRREVLDILIVDSDPASLVAKMLTKAAPSGLLSLKWT